MNPWLYFAAIVLVIVAFEAMTHKTKKRRDDAITAAVESSKRLVEYRKKA